MAKIHICKLFVKKTKGKHICINCGKEASVSIQKELNKKNN
jgi:hypothetical protein